MVMIPQYRVREVVSSGECGCVTLCTNREDCPWWTVDSDPRCRLWQGVSQWRLWTYDCRCRLWKGCHPGDCGLVNPGAWSEGGSHRKLCEPHALFGSPLPEGCGCVSPGSEPGRGCHHGDCRHGTPGIEFGRGSPWRLWTCEPRCRVWEVESLLGLLTGYPRCMVWESNLVDHGCAILGAGSGRCVTLHTVVT